MEETEFRYRRLPANRARLMSLTFWFALTQAALGIVFVPMTNALANLFLSDPLLSPNAAQLVEGWGIVAVFVVVLGGYAWTMTSIWIIMRWGNFSGGKLGFVRPHLADVAKQELAKRPAATDQPSDRSSD